MKREKDRRKNKERGKEGVRGRKKGKGEKAHVQVIFSLFDDIVQHYSRHTRRLQIQAVE